MAPFSQSETSRTRAQGRLPRKWAQSSECPCFLFGVAVESTGRGGARARRTLQPWRRSRRAYNRYRQRRARGRSSAHQPGRPRATGRGTIVGADRSGRTSTRSGVDGAVVHGSLNSVSETNTKSRWLPAGLDASAANRRYRYRKKIALFLYPLSRVHPIRGRNFRQPKGHAACGSYPRRRERGRLHP